MTHSIAVQQAGHVAEIVFGHPPHNHATVDLLRGIADALEALDRDPACRAIVLASEGKIFCAGAELTSVQGGGVGGAGADPLREFYDQALRLFAAKKPIVAAVQGAAVGAGLGLAIAADFRVAAPEARFAANFTALGFHPGFALSHTLPRLIGPQRTALMFMTARRFKPEEVLHWGLIDEIASAADLRAAAHRLAADIALNAPLALLATRKTLREGLAGAAAAALEREHAEQAILSKSADYAEGVRAVAERRAGRFIGG
jgi:enoyl-CoA hydratase/carnithine racemase